jgi:hypothetical protein
VSLFIISQDGFEPADSGSFRPQSKCNGGNAENLLKTRWKIAQFTITLFGLPVSKKRGLTAL